MRKSDNLKKVRRHLLRFKGTAQDDNSASGEGQLSMVAGVSAQAKYCIAKVHSFEMRRGEKM